MVDKDSLGIGLGVLEFNFEKKVLNVVRGLLINKVNYIRSNPKLKKYYYARKVVTYSWDANLMYSNKPLNRWEVKFNGVIFC